MSCDIHAMPLEFEKREITARFIDPSGEMAENRIEVRTNPITRRVSRVTFARIKEKEAGAGKLPDPPPDAERADACPFCKPRVERLTPRIHPDIFPSERMVRGSSLLFPNLFPYGAYSGVSLFDDRHFVEIGTASLESYTDCFINCGQYLERVLAHDPKAVFMAITQNHLPSAGGSLVHPHLQVHADGIASNHHRFLVKRAEAFHQQTGGHLFSEYLGREKDDGSRYIGNTGPWEWMAAFAPEGFFEIWGILPGVFSMRGRPDAMWEDLARGVIDAQKYYRSLFRNGYNLGLLSMENKASRLELRCVILARSNYAPWVRSDFTGYEVMLGDMATFSAPEETARNAKSFWGTD